jgi:hypothetical protein
VKANAGHRLEQIGAALKTDTAILKRPIANLLAAKKLRTEGQKRGTKYFAGGKHGAGGSGRRSKTRHDRKVKRARRTSSKRAVRRKPKAKTTATPTAAAA